MVRYYIEKYWKYAVAVLAAIILIICLIPSSNAYEIDGMECKIAMATMYYGDPNLCLVSYEITNNSDYPRSFRESFCDGVFQNGERCLIRTNYNGRQNDDIEPGETKRVSKLYVVKDRTADVRIEVRGSVQYERVIAKTFIF